jgi:hypothetical protein
MHGPPLLETFVVPSALIAAGLVMLIVSLWRKKTQPEGVCGFNVQPKILGHKIIETRDRWVFFSAFIALVAVGSHYLAEYTLHIYDVTPIDRFTHGLSGMAVTAFILNFNLTRGRRVYYPTAIGVSWLGFVAWEVYEWISVMTDPNTTIQTGPWDLAIDLWIDTLGALAICFIYDEYNKEKAKKAVA